MSGDSVGVHLDQRQPLTWHPELPLRGTVLKSVLIAYLQRPDGDVVTADNRFFSPCVTLSTLLRTWQKSPGRLMAQCLWCKVSAAHRHAAAPTNMPTGWRQSVPRGPVCAIGMPGVREPVKGRHVTDITDSWLFRRLITKHYNQPSYG